MQNSETDENKTDNNFSKNHMNTYIEGDKDERDSKVDRLLYLQQQRDLIEEVRQLIEMSTQIKQFQEEVTALDYGKWSKMNTSIEPLQEDIDFYVREYIVPIQEKKQELAKLDNSLISISEKSGIIGKLGKIFEKFIPGITKTGRQRREIEGRKQRLEDEINTHKTIIRRNPFQIFGANKDIKGELVAQMDLNHLEKYSSIQKDFRSNLESKNSVKSVANSVKLADMNGLLASYHTLDGQSSSLTSELINNGMESFNIRVNQMLRDNNQQKKELMTLIDFGVQGNSDKDILKDITQQMQSLRRKLTPNELDEFNKKRKDRQEKIERHSEKE